MLIKTAGGAFELDAYGIRDVFLKVPFFGEVYASVRGLYRGRRFFDAWKHDADRGFVLCIGGWSLDYNRPIAKKDRS